MTQIPQVFTWHHLSLLSNSKYTAVTLFFSPLRSLSCLDIFVRLRKYSGANKRMDFILKPEVLLPYMVAFNWTRLMNLFIYFITSFKNKSRGLYIYGTILGFALQLCRRRLAMKITDAFRSYTSCQHLPLIVFKKTVWIYCLITAMR